MMPKINMFDKNLKGFEFSVISGAFYIFATEDGLPVCKA